MLVKYVCEYCGKIRNTEKEALVCEEKALRKKPKFKIGEAVYDIYGYKYKIQRIELPLYRYMMHSENMTKIKEKMDKIDNIIIDREYEKSERSYDLAVISDLILAKYTSIGDECLALGIPVIFHDYAVNHNNNFSSFFRTSLARKASATTTRPSGFNIL